MSQVILNQASVRVETNPQDGSKAIVVDDLILLPAGGDRVVPLIKDTYFIPLESEAAEGLGNDLVGSRIVKADASALRALPDPPAKAA